MRCPKCGFISFDHLETCLKCKKNIKSASDSLQGTVYNVAAPAFLKFSVSDAAEETADDLGAFITADDDIDSVEIQDPDLDILIDDSSDDDSSGGIEFEVEEEAEFTLDIDGDDADFEADLDKGRDDAEISLDMDAFGDEEDAFAGIDEEDVGAEDAFSMDIPDELSDMSDLEPPTPPAEEAPVESAPAAVEDDFGLDLDLDADGLDSGDLGASSPSDSLSLDDDLDLGGFDLDEPPAPAAGKKPSKGKLNLDDDLDFELDLGDLLLDDK